MRAARIAAAAAAVVALTLALAVAGCSRRPIVGQEVTGLDRKLSTYAWIEDGNLVTFIVGTRAARYRDQSGYMPVEIAIANVGIRTMRLTRESFTLVDESGARYPCAGPEELMTGYDFLDLDRDSLAELEGITTTRFGAFQRYPSQFSPTRASVTAPNIVRDLVSLPRYGYLIDYLYFPKPATGIKGHRFELFLDSPELENPVFVKFAVE